MSERVDADARLLVGATDDGDGFGQHQLAYDSCVCRSTDDMRQVCVGCVRIRPSVISPPPFWYQNVDSSPIIVCHVSAVEICLRISKDVIPRLAPGQFDSDAYCIGSN